MNYISHRDEIFPSRWRLCVFPLLVLLKFLINVCFFNIKFGQFGASFILKFGQIEALQNSGNLLKIRGDWSVHFGQMKVPPFYPFFIIFNAFHLLSGVPTVTSAYLGCFSYNDQVGLCTCFSSVKLPSTTA